jgi:hypothetical protein
MYSQLMAITIVLLYHVCILVNTDNWMYYIQLNVKRRRASKPFCVTAITNLHNNIIINQFRFIVVHYH